MKAHLLYRDRDFDFEAETPWNAAELVEDLGLETVVEAMSAGDAFLATVARAVLLRPVCDTRSVRYRQDVLGDCVAHPDVAHAVYDLAVDAIAGERKIYGGLLRSPTVQLHRSVEVLELFVGVLRRLRQVADDDRDTFGSEGMTGLLAMLRAELSDDYFAEITAHLKQLRFARTGVLISSRLGAGNTGVDFVLRSSGDRGSGLLARLTGHGEPSYSFAIAPRDDAGMRALSEMQDRGLNQVTNAVAQSTDHILSFFRMLRAEVGFFLSCVHLHERLTAKGEPVCRPTPYRPGERIYRTRGLYDVGLSLRNEQRVVGNDVDAAGKSLIVITGANTGGKSTFLRSAGIAQLMMQAGMFVGADSFEANLCGGVATHYKREEDATMTSGKFDEELGRLSRIADQLGPNHLLLSNESFSSTNEQEGSEIGRQALHALLACDVEVFLVTHLFDLADSLRRGDDGRTLFLRAERREGGERSFRLSYGEPLPTSYGRDLFERVFGGTERTAS